MHCDLVLAVSKQWDATAARDPEKPAAREVARGETAPISSIELKFPLSQLWAGGAKCSWEELYD